GGDTTVFTDERQRGGRFGWLILFWTLVIGVSSYSIARFSYKYNVPLFVTFAVLSAVSIRALVPEARRTGITWTLVIIAIVASVLSPLVPDIRTHRYDSITNMRKTIQTLVP